MLCGRRPDRGERMTTTIDPERKRAHFITADLSEEVACVRVVVESLSKFRRLDILINNAAATDGPKNGSDMPIICRPRKPLRLGNATLSPKFRGFSSTACVMAAPGAPKDHLMFAKIEPVLDVTKRTWRIRNSESRTATAEIKNLEPSSGDLEAERSRFHIVQCRYDGGTHLHDKVDGICDIHTFPLWLEDNGLNGKGLA